MSPKRGAYQREFREEAVRMLRAGREPNELARELGVTPGTLRVWLHVADGGFHGLSRSREGAIAQTVEPYEHLDRVLAGVPRSALETPLGFSAEAIDPWRVKDAVAHVTHYKSRSIQRLVMRQRRAGDPPPDAVQKRIDEYWAPEPLDELEASDDVLRTMDARTRRRHGPNHLVYMRWRDRTPDEVVAWHRLVHEHVIAMLENAPQTWFEGSGGSYRSSPPRLSQSAVGELGLHVSQHVRDIERALARNEDP